VSNEDQENAFDELGAKSDDKSQNISKKHEKMDYLIHRIFYQTDEGVQLLNIWKNTTLMNASARSGSDLLTIGLSEGKKDFVRNIILTIEGVNNG
jgi:hypothetical protein